MQASSQERFNESPSPKSLFCKYFSQLYTDKVREYIGIEDEDEKTLKQLHEKGKLGYLKKLLPKDDFAALANEDVGKKASGMVGKAWHSVFSKIKETEKGEDAKKFYIRLDREMVDLIHIDYQYLNPFFYQVATLLYHVHEPQINLMQRRGKHGIKRFANWCVKRSIHKIRHEKELVYDFKHVVPWVDTVMLSRVLENEEDAYIKNHEFSEEALFLLSDWLVKEENFTYARYGFKKAKEKYLNIPPRLYDLCAASTNVTLSHQGVNVSNIEGTGNKKSKIERSYHRVRDKLELNTLMHDFGLNHVTLEAEEAIELINEYRAVTENQAVLDKQSFNAFVQARFNLVKAVKVLFLNVSFQGSDPHLLSGGNYAHTVWMSYSEAGKSTLSFNGLILDEAIFNHAELIGATFEDTSIYNTHFKKAILKQTKFKGVEERAGAVFTGASREGSDFYNLGDNFWSEAVDEPTIERIDEGSTRSDQPDDLGLSNEGAPMKSENEPPRRKQIHIQRGINFEGMKFEVGATIKMGRFNANMDVEHNNPEELTTVIEAMSGSPIQGTFGSLEVGDIDLQKKVRFFSGQTGQAHLEALASNFFNRANENYPNLISEFIQVGEDQFLLSLEEGIDKKEKKAIRKFVISEMIQPLNLDEDYVSLCKAGVRIEIENTDEAERLTAIVQAYETYQNDSPGVQ